MEQSSTEAQTTDNPGVTFLGPGDELTPGAVEALNRRTPEELAALAESAVNRL